MSGNRIEASIRFDFQQLVWLGMHLGHLEKNSIFLTQWFFYLPINEVFIIELIMMYLNIKMMLKILKGTVLNYRVILFVSLYKKYDFLSWYAIISGEYYILKGWIIGMLSNYTHVFKFLRTLLRFFNKNEFFFRQKDKKKFLVIYKILVFKKKKPSLGFLPKKHSIVASDFVKGRVPVISFIDSNIISDTVLVPIVANDDSSVCVNYFSFFIVYYTLKYKFLKLKYLRFIFSFRRKRRRKRKLLILSLLQKKNYKIEWKVKIIKKKFSIINEVYKNKLFSYLLKNNEKKEKKYSF